jgi:hypothetical protein
VVPGLVPPALTPRPATPPFLLPPSQDHLEVGGRLRHFFPFRKEELETSPQLLQAVEGFHVPTAPAFPRACFSTPSQGSYNSLVDAEVAALLEKGAIKEVELHPPSLGYFSIIFFVQKKNG